MKVNNNSVVNIANTNNNKCAVNNKQSFKGIGTFIGDANLGLMNLIEKGGFPAEFCLMDFSGMAAPRSWQGFNRNKKELGHLNIKAGLEELIREGITGPSLFAIPFAIVGLSGWFMGQGTRIKTKLLNGFSDIFKEITPDVANSENAKKEFVSKLFNKLFEGVPGYTASNDDKENFFNHLTATFKDTKTEKKAGNFANFMADLNARHLKNDNTGAVKLFGEEFKVDDLFLDARKYMDDVIPSVQKTLKEDIQTGKKLTSDILNNAVDGITKIRHNGRKLMCVGGTAVLAAFLCIIPKLYQLSKKNPALDGMGAKKTSEVKK